MFKILFDCKEGEYFIGCIEGDFLEVDNEVLVKVVDNYVCIGDFVLIKIIRVEDYDLYGEVEF